MIKKQRQKYYTEQLTKMMPKFAEWMINQKGIQCEFPVWVEDGDFQVIIKKVD